jgi:signal transduction histidine kinase/DNA-binding NarL/FixJ family response regulator
MNLPIAASLPKVSSEAVPAARILLVDDDANNLMALSHVLEDVAEVVTAPSGREALRHLLSGEFAVVLLDVFMPDMDGYEVAELIRQREQTARVPIIFLSAVNKDTEHLMRGYAMGAVDYVFKPVDAIMLRSKVAVFVDLYLMRLQVEAQGRAEREMREARFRAELERFQLKAELQASRNRQAAMLDVLPLVLYEGVADASGALVRTFMGGDLSRLAGPDAAAIEAAALAWEAQIHPDDRKLLPSLDDAHAEGRLSFEYRWQCGDGTTRHFIEHCVRVPSLGGPTRWAGTLIDVSEQKRLEAQLLQAGKMEAIGQLTGGVAHDFNNLLATVLGGIRLLQRRLPLGETEQTIVEQMQRAAEKGAELVKRLMAFARKQDLRPVSIAPSSLCRSVGDLVEQTLGPTFTLEWDCAEIVRNVLADQTQLELSLVNLVLNARDAMPEGGNIRVAITDASKDQIRAAGLPDRNFLAIEVSDDGVGIPPELLGKIAEPFFTTKAMGKGTGLGLSMTVGFVQQSGGRLNIVSEPGRGTTITILLPSTGKPSKVGNPSTAELDMPELSVRSVLLVDDDEMVRTVMSEQLVELGLEVRAMPDARGALELLACPDQCVDLMLTDFAMPEVNGLQAILQARRIRPGLKAVIMTGYMDDAIDPRAARGIEILRKPVPPNELVRILT